MAEKMLKIKQIKSSICCSVYQRKVLKGLGIRKLQQTVLRVDSPEIRGMINKISHLLTWEQTSDTDTKKE